MQDFPIQRRKQEVSDFLLENRRLMNLGPIRLLIALNLVKLWHPEKHPFIKKSRLKSLIGVSEESIGQNLTILKESGLIIQEHIGPTVVYNINPLLEQVDSYLNLNRPKVIRTPERFRKPQSIKTPFQISLQSIKKEMK